MSDRKPTKTVRVDLDSHEDLKRLAVMYAADWSRHVSVVDVVRMGITLLFKDRESRQEVQP
jgi:hypothetical protein